MKNSNISKTMVDVSYQNSPRDQKLDNINNRIVDTKLKGIDL